MLILLMMFFFLLGKWWWWLVMRWGGAAHQRGGILRAEFAMEFWTEAPHPSFCQLDPYHRHHYNLTCVEWYQPRQCVIIWLLPPWHGLIQNTELMEWGKECFVRNNVHAYWSKPSWPVLYLLALRCSRLDLIWLKCHFWSLLHSRLLFLMALLRLWRLSCR